MSISGKSCKNHGDGSEVCELRAIYIPLKSSQRVQKEITDFIGNLIKNVKLLRWLTTERKGTSDKMEPNV